MRKIQLLGLLLVAVFAFSTITASGASALESVFLVNGVKPTSEVSVDSQLVTGTEFKIEDTNVPIFGKVDISCTAVEIEGAIGDETNAKIDLLTLFNFLSCVSLTLGITILRFSVVHLAWLTEVLLSGSTYLDGILPISGRPGFEFEVETAFGKSTDECGSSTKSVDLVNTTENDIVALFLETETWDCSQGGAGAGLVVGEFLTATLSGQSLAVSEA